MIAHDILSGGGRMWASIIIQQYDNVLPSVTVHLCDGCLEYRRDTDVCVSYSPTKRSDKIFGSLGVPGRSRLKSLKAEYWTAMLSALFIGGLVGTGTGMADITPGSQGW